jgi:hypothetical protein
LLDSFLLNTCQIGRRLIDVTTDHRGSDATYLLLWGSFQIVWDGLQARARQAKLLRKLFGDGLANCAICKVRNQSFTIGLVPVQ